LQLPEGKILDQMTIDRLSNALIDWLDETAQGTLTLDSNYERVFIGMSYLCIWIDWNYGGIKLWSIVAPVIQKVVTDSNTRIDTVVLLSACLVRMQTAGWLAGEVIIKTVQFELLKLLDSTGLKPEPRAAVGDSLGKLGDPRFSGAYSLPLLSDSDAPEAPPGFVKIEPSEFFFGKNNTKMRHSKPFYMSRYLVTVAQYDIFLLDEASRNSNAIGGSSKGQPLGSRLPSDWTDQLTNLNRPVYGVSWFDAMAYVAWLEAKRQAGALGNMSFEVAGYTLRLPTEAEWERAARAGGESLYPWGDATNDIDQRANVAYTVGHATAVGAYPPNALGLHDMAGNLWEWQANVFEEKYANALVAPEKLKNGGSPALRGGSWLRG
jgi:Sulfatase-modifying factor enzyme 1